MRLALCLFIVAALHHCLIAQDANLPGPEKIGDINELAKRLALSVEGAIVDGDVREILEATGPVLTHIDDVASTTLWICFSEVGRPEVVLAVSSWRDQRFIEACSFSEHSLEFKIMNTEWRPSPARMPTAINDAPPPAESEADRLKQMQELLKRFGGSQAYLGREVEFEIPTKPIYRYSQSSRTNDGALFIMARDGDPEALLVLESSKDGWQYMVGRMTGNPMSYSLDGKQKPVEFTRNLTAPYIFVRRQPE